ncbi:hypothetical protein IAU60_002758 [Kwoniella sp. DSM 27419]
MHKLNPYLEKRPDFALLASRFPDFAPFVTISAEGYPSIDFQDAAALRALTRCLLKEDWDLDVDLREDRICPTVSSPPAPIDYLLHLLDLEPYLPSTSSSRPLRILDVGTGASAIYSILLHRLRPEAEIVATELDETSYAHALTVLNKNHIPYELIAVRKAPSAEPILFPILDDETARWDFTLCNPPFFGSEEELQEGQQGKARGAHAAPTAAQNELITPGGEVAFVGRMIEESIGMKERCCWFTSLIGKFSSLQPLVDLLRQKKMDNYFVRNIRQAKTTRWILGWSHQTSRLPDSIARPEDVTPNTAFTRLLPTPNTFDHKPSPPMLLDDIRQSVVDVLLTIQLNPSKESTDRAQYESDDLSTILLEPTSNTWSRAARRQAARAADQGHDQPQAPIFRARVRFAPPAREIDGASLALDWLQGDDRSEVEALWKYVLSKAGLIGKKLSEDAGYGSRLGGGYATRGQPEWRARGRGGPRGRTQGRSLGRQWDGEGKRDRSDVQGGNEEEYVARGGQRRRLA